VTAARGDHQEQRELRTADKKLLHPATSRSRETHGYVISMTNTIPQIVSNVFPTAYVTV
jgi:hypothetical protein